MNNIQRVIAATLFTLITQNNFVGITEIELKDVEQNAEFGSADDYYFVRFIGQGVSDLSINASVKKNFLTPTQIANNETVAEQMDVPFPSSQDLGSDFTTDFMLISRAEMYFSGSIKFEGYKLS